MAGLVLDTHTVLWHVLDPERLSPTATTAIDDACQHGETLWVSAISVIEIIYLVEKWRFALDDLHRVLADFDDPSSAFAVHAVTREVADAMFRIDRAAVPDMPDRIIAATALLLDVALVTRDHRIRIAAVPTIW